MNRLVRGAINVLRNPEQYDEDAAISIFLDADRGLYLSDLRSITEGMTILRVGKILLASAKILLDAWKCDSVDFELGSVMATYECIKKMADVLEQFNDYAYALDVGKETALMASNLRVTILNVESYHHNMFNVDIIKMPDTLKFAYLAADAALSQAFHIIDDIIDRTAGRK